MDYKILRPGPLLLLLVGFLAGPSVSANPGGAVISFECGLAIDAVFAELDRQSENPVTQEALSKIDENGGEFVCLPADRSTIYLWLQVRDIKAGDNRLAFTVDTNTYKVLKTQYGP